MSGAQTAEPRSIAQNQTRKKQGCLSLVTQGTGKPLYLYLRHLEAKEGQAKRSDVLEQQKGSERKAGGAEARTCLSACRFVTRRAPNAGSVTSRPSHRAQPRVTSHSHKSQVTIHKPGAIRAAAAMGRGRWLLLLALAAACLAAYPMPALGGPHHGCFYEEHMQQMLGLEDHTNLHAHIHEASRKAQARAEAVAASGSGTSHYLKWRLSQLPDSDTYSDSNSDSDSGSGRHGFVSLERGRALEVMSGSVNSTALQPPGLNSAPGPADINIIPPRHGSAVAPGVVDWRASPAVSTNITDQMAVSGRGVTKRR